MLNVFLFGTPRFAHDGQSLELSRRKATALMAYLIVTRRIHSREGLAAMFWPDIDQSRAYAYLRTTVWTINKDLGDGWLLVDRENISVDFDAELDVDVLRFRQLAQASDVASWQQAAALYTDDFLAGFSLPDSEGFEEWQFFHREELRHIGMDVYEKLANHMIAQGIYDDAFPHIRRWLALDNFNETAHRTLMQLYALTNQRAMAVRQYQFLTDMLESELGIAPQPATVELYRAIADGRVAHVQPVTVVASPQSATITQTVEVVRQSIPAQNTPFVSREAERDEITQLLDDPACRLLTLLGPGGIGKTRLAIQVAEDALEQFEDGVFFIPLAPVGSAEMLHSTLIDQFKLSGVEADKRIQESNRLWNFLRQRRLLLVMDNFEHLMDGAGFLTDILNHAPHVKIVVTSRERLNLQGEWIFEIQGLLYPQLTDDPRFDTYGAVQLFVQSARRVRPDLTLTAQDRAALVDVCRMVDGMPLAVELAAAWVQLLSIPEIAHEIAQSIDFLAASVRNLPDRHRSIRAVMESAWERLNDDEQRVLRQLTVFRGGFRREAARDVAGATLPLLLSLVNKSLISVDVFGRYDIHELLRQFAQEKLNALPQEQAGAYERHAAYFLRFLHDIEPKMKRHGQIDALNEVDAEGDNLFVVWQWALEQQQAQALHVLLDGFTVFYSIRNRIREIRELIEHADHALKTAPSDQDMNVVRAYIKALCCRIYDWSGEDEKSEQVYQQAYRLIKPLAGRDDLANIYILMASYDTWWNRNMEEAIDYSQRAYDLFEALQDRWGMALALQIIGNAYHHHMCYDESAQYYRRSLEVSTEIGDIWGQGQTIGRLSEVAFTLGHYAEAEQLSWRALELAEAVGDVYSTAYYMGKIGHYMALQGRYDDAYVHMTQSIQLHQERGSRYSVAAVIYNLGSLAMYQGRYDEAEAHLQDAYQRFLDYDTDFGRTWVRFDHSQLAFNQGQYERAYQLALEAYQTAQRMNDPWALSAAAYYRGQVLIELGAYAEARPLLMESLASAIRNTSIMMLCRHVIGWARLLGRTGEDIQHAVALLTMVIEHHATWASDKQYARSLCDELIAGNTDEFDAAIRRGQTLDIWQVSDAITGVIQVD